MKLSCVNHFDVDVRNVRKKKNLRCLFCIERNESFVFSDFCFLLRFAHYMQIKHSRIDAPNREDIDEIIIQQRNMRILSFPFGSTSLLFSSSVFLYTSNSPLSSSKKHNFPYHSTRKTLICNTVYRSSSFLSVSSQQAALPYSTPHLNSAPRL